MTEAQDYGWSVKAGAFDWPRFQVKLNAELDRLEGVYRRLLTNSDVTIYDARAKVKDAHTVTLSTGQDVTANFPFARAAQTHLDRWRRVHRLRICLHPERDGRGGDAILPRRAGAARL